MEITNIFQNNGDQDEDSLLIDLNILPSRYRRKKITLTKILPWVLWVALVGLTYPVLMTFYQAQTSFQQTKSSFQSLQATVEVYQPQSVEMESLQAKIDTAQQTLEEIQSSSQNVEMESPLWSEPLSTLMGHIPQGMTLTSVAQSGNQISVEGHSNSYQQILDMKEILKAEKQFPSVELQSINRVNKPEATPPTTFDFVFNILINEEGAQP